MNSSLLTTISLYLHSTLETIFDAQSSLLCTEFVSKFYREPSLVNGMLFQRAPLQKWKLLGTSDLSWPKVKPETPHSRRNENCQGLQIWVYQQLDQRTPPPLPRNEKCQGRQIWVDQKSDQRVTSLLPPMKIVRKCRLHCVSPVDTTKFIWCIENVTKSNTKMIRTHVTNVNKR